MATQIFYMTDKPKFDPTKNYKWDIDTEFKLDGQEFGFVYNLLLKEKRELLRKLDAINMLEMKLREAVEEGRATEMEPPKKVDAPNG